MTDPSIIQYLEQMCVKNGDIKIENVSQTGTYTLIIPVYHGAMELNPEQIATLQMEFSFDGDDVILHNFPKKLLSEEDYNQLLEAVWEVMTPVYESLQQAQEFKSLANKYGFRVIEESGKYKLCAKNTDNQWTLWISYDPQMDVVSWHGNTDFLNIWLCDTRKDFTPEKCLQFVADLNNTFALSGENKLLVRELIDPEDWQEIANVRDAYEDKRYTTGKLSSIESIIDAAQNKAADVPLSYKNSKNIPSEHIR